MCDGCTDGTVSTCPQCPVPPYPSIDPLMAHGTWSHPHRSRSSPPRVLISGHRGPGLGAGTMAGEGGGRSPGGPRFRGRYLTILNTHRGSVRSDHTAPGSDEGEPYVCVYLEAARLQEAAVARSPPRALQTLECQEWLDSWEMVITVKLSKHKICVIKLLMSSKSMEILNIKFIGNLPGLTG